MVLGLRRKHYIEAFIIAMVEALFFYFGYTAEQVSGFWVAVFAFAVLNGLIYLATVAKTK